MYLEKLRGMKIQASDLIDRYSILTLKSHRSDVDVTAELNEYKSAISELPNSDTAISFANRLYEVNGMIWDLESDIRNYKEDELGMEEVGRRALQIRDLNKDRIAIKNEITSFYNDGFKEVKINHKSE